MSHEDLPQRVEVASAYLDGELEPDARAAAAADPDTMAVVEAFSVLRNAIAEVEPAAVSSRTAAIAAALAEYDTRRAPELEAPAPARAPLALFRRRERAYRMLVGATAAAAVLVVAVAALASMDRGSDNEASVATESPALAPPATSGERAASSPAATESPSVMTEKLGVPEIDSPEALRQYASSVGAVDAATAELPAAPGGTAGTTAAPSTVAAAGTAPREAVAADSAPCVSANDLYLGEITVLGVPALATQDLSTGDVKAIAADDCRVLFTVTP